jgi:ferredoxin-fold anticodon binding domain-containing protein
MAMSAERTMTIGTPITFQRKKGCRIMSGIVQEVHENYLIVVVGGKFQTLRPEQVRVKK